MCWAFGFNNRLAPTSNPHTPLFPMETQNTQTDRYSELVREITENTIKNINVPLEINKNPMTVGSDRFSTNKEIYWQPHNIRLYFDFDRLNFNQPKPSLKVGCRYINGTEFEVSNFCDCRIVVKKKQIEITNKIEHKKFYIIRLGQTGKAQMQEIILKKILEGKEVLKLFIAEFGGNTKYDLLNYSAEDKLANDRVIDMLPLKMRFENEILKKAYNEPNIEIKNPIYAMNYVSTRAIEDIAPQIAQELSNLRNELIEQKKPAEIKPMTAIEREVMNINSIGYKLFCGQMI